MAREYYLHPEDIPKNKAVGITLPFNRNTYNRTAQQAYNAPPARDVGPFQLSYSTEDQAVSNYINLLLTRRGERVMHPDFGTLVRDMVFDQNDEFNRLILETDIRDQTELWLPYIRLHRLEIGLPTREEFPTNETLHGMLINIVFSVFDAGANRTIKIYVSDTGDLQTEVT